MIIMKQSKKKASTMQEKREKAKKFGVDLLFILAGCSLGAFASIGIMIPNNLSGGGITGMVRILQNYVNIDFSVLYYSGALIVFMVCLIVLGWKEARKILLMTLLFPMALIIFEQFNLVLLEEKDIFLAAIYQGVIAGIGSGFIFVRGYSFGGTDTIAKILRKKLLPQVSMSQILLIIDACVIIGSGFVFGRNIALYALISQLIYTKTVEFVMYGFDPQMVQVEIITNKHDEIVTYILNEIGRGVTNIAVIGEYSGTNRDKIVTLCSPRESILIKNYVAKTDKHAFVTVIHVDNVWGNGSGFGSLTE